MEFTAPSHVFKKKKKKKIKYTSNLFVDWMHYIEILWYFSCKIHKAVATNGYGWSQLRKQKRLNYNVITQKQCGPTSTMNTEYINVRNVFNCITNTAYANN